MLLGVEIRGINTDINPDAFNAAAPLGELTIAATNDTNCSITSAVNIGSFKESKNRIINKQ